VTLVTLPGVTDAATMRKISYWRYSAVNLKTLFAALACALLVFSVLGCGTTNHLQSITLTPASGGSGLFNVKGIGGIQSVATGNYSSGKTKDLTNVVTYSVVPDPNWSNSSARSAIDRYHEPDRLDDGSRTCHLPVD
jgi:hypothetical protein